MQYKIVYYVGEDITLKTVVQSGVLTLDNGTILVSGPSPLELPLSSVSSVEMFRLHGLGRMLKIRYGNKTLYLTVVRFNIANRFVMVNFLKTGALYKKLLSAS